MKPWVALRSTAGTPESWIERPGFQGRARGMLAAPVVSLAGTPVCAVGRPGNISLTHAQRAQRGDAGRQRAQTPRPGRITSGRWD